jgi:hypothetical protein
MKREMQTGERWAMKSRKLWYVIALSTLCLVAAKLAMAQEQAPPPEAQEQAPLPDTSGQDQGQPPYDAGQQQGQPPYGAAGQDQGPPPTAARIGILNGQVSMMRGDSGEWVAGIVNAPLMQGDTVATAAHSRTEVQLDFANIMRLDQNAQVKIVALWQKHIQIQVASGTVDFVVFKGSEADAEIDTPNMAVIPQGPGVYRIQIDSDSQTELTVRSGRAQVSTPEGSTAVDSGCVIYVRGTDNPEYQIANAGPNDEWDRWNTERDRSIEQAQSWQYTNRYYTGAQDLDQYGTWQNVPDYGQVWSPNAGPDWSPYYDGNWTWEPYWGWTWVSYEPWGWAPYHYGRWFCYGSRWCWWPGVGFGGLRPLWAPAYVSFLGLGRGIGIGLNFGFGSIGWLALGPFDAVFGWWGHHNGYGAVGIGSIARIGNYGGGLGRIGNGRMSNLQAALTNPNVRRGITTMPANDFGRGMATRGFGRGVDAATLRSGQMMRGSLPVTPTRASLMPGNRMASRSAIPSRSMSSMHFYSRNSGATRAQSFNQRPAQTQQMGRQGANSMGSNVNIVGARQGGYGNATRPNIVNSRPSTGSAQGQSGNSGWQRFASRSPYSSPAQGRSGGFAAPSRPSYGGYNNGGYGAARSQPGANDRSYQSRPGGGYGYPRQNQAAPSNRGGGWNAPAPRSSAPSWGQWSGGRSYGGYGGRPTLNMNKPIVVRRSNAPRSYGGGRGAAPSGGRGERSGGGHTSGGEHFGGGGGHSGGGGGHSGGGGGHGRR